MADVRKTVEIVLKANAQKLNKSLKDAQGGFASFAKGILKGGAAAVAFGAAIVKMNQAVANMINELSDASTITGISVENLSALKLAAEGSGKSLSSIQPALIRFQQSMDRANQGTGRQSELFEQLGVAVANSDGSLRDSNSVFEETISILSKMEKGTERNTIVMELFGRTSGASLTQSGAIDSMKAFNSHVSAYGLNIGPKAREEAADWQRAMADFKMVSERALQDVVSALTGGASLASALREATGSFIFMKSVVGDVFNFLKGVLSAVIGQMTAFVAAIGQVNFNEWSSAMAMIVNPLTAGEGFKKIGQISENIRSMVLDLNKANNQFAIQASDNIMNIGSRAAKAQQEFIKSAKAITGSGTKIGGRNGGLPSSSRGGIESQQKKLTDLAVLQKEIDTIMGDTVKKYDSLTPKTDELIDKYTEKIDRLKEINELSKGQLDTTKEENQLIQSFEIELAELRIANIDAIREAEAKAAEERKKEEEAQLQRMISNISTYGTAVTGYFSDFGSAIHTTLQNTGELTEKQAKRLHNIQKFSGISDVIINKSVAVMKAYAQFGPIGGALAAIPLSAIAAAQIAAISTSKPPSFHQGGIIKSNSDEITGNLLNGEAVLNRRAVKKLGERGVNSLNNGAMKNQVVVTNSFKHFDRFLSSSMRNNSRMRRLVNTSSGRK